MRKRLLFIYNPNAGMGKIGSKLSSIVEIMSQAGYDVIIYPTEKRMDAREKAIEYVTNDMCDRIVCAGGDGTLNEIAGGLMIAGKAVPLGYIPSGTTNDFGYSLKIPKNYLEAAELAVQGESFYCDIGSINGTYFTYTATFGLFSDVSYDTPQNLKNVLGRSAYILSGITKLGSVKKYTLRVEYDNVVFEDDFIFGMFANSDSVGGFKGLAGKDVMYDDGLFEMLLVRMPHNVIELNSTILDLLRGNMESVNLHYARISKVQIVSEEPLYWAIDGEDGGNIKNVEILVYKQALQYICMRKSELHE